MANYRRTLSEDEKDKFAYELALGYYEPEQLRHVFKLLPKPFEELCANESMQARVMAKQREIDESDNALRIHARKAARTAINNMSNLVKDEDAPAKTRMDAARQLREYAFAADKGALERPGDPEAGPTFIKTNLEMGADARGTYQITARDIEEQEAESAAALREEHGDDFADLIGV